MNHIYRSIWNDITATYVAAAETSKSGGKKASSSTGSLQAGRWALRALAASMCLAYGTGASALPQGGVVAAGSANVTATPGNMTIVQASQSAVLNWQSFSIGAGEAVQFVQPNANAVALNRVVGSDPSAILGKLSANGKVFLVNPNGILFGKGASVNVGGLVASALDIKDSDFMAGRYRFSGSSTQAVSNQGTINAPGGYVAMLGAHVSNDGVIAARMGSVALAGGQAITLDVAGDGLLNVSVNQGAVNALVSNGGMIQADGGQVLLTAQAAGKLLNTVVNNTGIIQAQTLVNHNGSIKLLGDMQTGTVNAAGTLDASAPAGGHGGFIETSAAHVKIDDALKVTTAASANGLTGTWLIDPTDYTIAATGGDQTGAFFTNALKTTSVQIQSISGGSGVLGDINVNDTISWSANQLKLTAQNNINANQPLRGSGTASLALEYGQANVASGNTSKYNVRAEIDLPSGSNFSTKLGSDGALTNYTVINSLGPQGSTSGSDLQGLRGAVSGNYVLGANIDASATSSWNSGLGFTPIGTSGIPFSGQFDGLGHVITGLNSSTTSSAGLAGLFGSNSGSIRNIGLVAPVIAGNIVATQGNVAALAAINSGSISNAYVSGGSVTITTGAIGAGLVGLNSGTISDSYNSSKVSVIGNYDFWLGGLVGNTTKTSNIVNSYNLGEVIGAYTAGGLVGNNLGRITDSFNSGKVSGTINTGGITSYNRATGIITNSFNTGTVTGASLTGGLVGSNVASSQILNSYSTGAVSSRGLTGTGFGGLVGGNSGIISNSYATGAVTGVTAVGGVVGTNTSAGSITNVYSSGAVKLLSGGSGTLGGVVGSIAAGTSPAINGGFYNTTVNSGMQGVGTNNGITTPSITGLTSTQMQTASSFTTFSFTITPGVTGNNWVMVNTDGTLNNTGGTLGATGPMLASEHSTTIKSSHQLQLMAMNLAGNYTLGMDINAAGTGTTGDVWNGATFVPVGANTSSPFTGTFDGAGHVISGLVVNRPGTDSTGLFGATSSTAIVRNVGLENGSVTGKDSTGALVGSNAGLVSGNYSNLSVTGSTHVGGLVGSNSGTVSNSYASGTVSGGVNVGGLVGLNSGSLTHSYATGAVSGTLSVGGLVGASSGSSSGSFWDATATGQATSATGTGLTTAQMKQLATYSGASWDLTSTWIVYDGNTSPLLRAFMTPLLVTFASNASKTYDGTSSWTAPGVTSSNAYAYGQLQGSLNYGEAGSAVNAGTYAITAGGLYSGQRGYAISSNNATLTIDRKVATVTGATVTTRDYNGSTAATISGATVSGVLAQDVGNVTVNTGSFDTKDAGSGKSVTAITTGSAGGNYIATATGLTGSITPKALTLTGVAASDKVYDGNTEASLTGGTLSGLVGSETVGLASLAGAFTDKNAGSGKAVSVTGGSLSNGSNGGLASNYSVGPVTGLTASIAQKVLTVTGVTAANKTYDGNDKASLSGGTLSGLVGSETLILSGQSGVFSDKNAGTGKTVTVSGATLGDAGSGATEGLASNYTVSNATGVIADISKASISSVSNIVADTKVYDGNTKATVSAASATFNGMVSGDSLSLSATSAVFADKNAGNKTVTVSGIALGGTDAGNYILASSTGTGTGNITPKALTIVGMSAVNKVYDGNTKASLSGGSIVGLVGSETLGVTGLSATFDTKDAGSAKTVTAIGTTLVNGGNGGLASNYTMSNPTGFTANITPKALTVSGMTAGTRVYDGTTAATLAGGSLSGLVSGETLGLAGGTGVFADQNAGNGKAVTVSGLSLSDGANGLASNYTVSNPTGVTGTIDRKALTVSGVTAGNKTYDGSTVATLAGGTLDGLVGTETLNLSGQSGAFSDQNAAVGKTVTVTGATLGNGTGLASNYTVSNATGVTADITAKALTVSGVIAGNKTYDGSTDAALSGGTLNGLVGNETLTLTGQSGAFSDQNAGAGKTVTVTGATLGNGTGLASNYTVSNASGVTADITAKALTVSGVTAGNKTYDGSTAATLSGGTLNGLVGSETLSLTGQSGTFSDQNAGASKTVIVTGATLGNGTGLASNYTVSNATGVTADITAKALTVSGVTAGNKTYDGTTAAALSGGTLNGLVGSETLSLTGQSGAFSDQNAGAGKTVIVTGTTLGNGTGLASNYTVSNATGVTADINAKALTVSGVTAGNKTYDGTTVANLSGGSLNGLVGSETLTLTGQSGAFSDQNAGAGKTVTVTGATLGNGTGLASNYTVSNATGVTADITAKALTVSGVTAGNKTYDGSTAATLSGGTLNGLVGTETLSLTGQSGTFSDQNAGAGKTVIVTGATLGNGTGLASNYTVSNATGVTADITAKALTVSGVTAGNKTYDGTTVANLSGGSLNGLVGSETLTLTGQSGAFSDQNAAVGKTVTVTGATLGNGTGLASNYTVSNATGVTADITAKELTVTGVTAGNKTYDGTTAAALSGGTLNGLVGTETLSLTGQSGTFSDQNAGAGKTVIVTGATLGNGTGLASNYTVSNATGVTADITAKALTVSGVTAGNKTYDGTAVASLSGGSLNGLVGSETLTLTGQSGTFSDQNAGAGKTVTVTGATLGNGTGLASNYTVSNATGVTADINAKALTVSGVTAGNKTYDGTTVAALSGGTLNGLVGSETLVLSGQTGTFADKNVAAGKTVTVTGATLGNGTGLASNYTVSNATGVTADITAKALTVSGVTAGNKTYDGTTVAALSGGTLNGLVGNETLTLTGQTGTFADKNVAAGQTVTVTGATLGNGTGLASNYTVSNATGVTADITAKALTVSGVTAGNKTYDGTTAAALSGGTLNGLVGSETLTLTGQSGAFSDQNAAVGKTVTVTGATLGNGTGLASNYTVSNATGVTADITAKALTVSGVTAGNKTYDGTTVATLSGGTLVGLVGQETLALSGQSGQFNDQNAGNNKAVTVSGAALADAGSGATAGLASNYTVSNPTGVTGNIDRKALTVTGQLVDNKVYDGNTVASLTGGALSGLVGSETLGIAGQTAVFADKNAANGKGVSVTGTTLVDGTGLASNYSVTNPTGLTASITQKALTVTGQQAGKKVYDGNVVASLSGGALNGLVAGETLGIAGQTATFADKDAANGKTVTVTGTTLVDTSTGLASNYTVNNPTGLMADITPKALTIAGVTAGNKVYDGNAVATLSGGSLSGLVGSETLGLAGLAGAFSDQNAADGKTVTLTGASLVDGTGLASNYAVSNPTALVADITPKALTIAGMTAANKVFDGTPVASLSGGTLTGLVGNETLGLSGSTGAFDSASVGSAKPVTVSGSTLSDGSGLASNYSVSNPTGLKADITAVALPAALVADQPTAGSVGVSAGVGNSPFADPGYRHASLGTQEVASDASERPVLQTGASVPFSLAALRFAIRDNGIRLPPGVLQTSKDGLN